MTDRYISIIIPAYNVETYLEECLLSLVNQNISANDYEIICVDDGSTDNTVNILDKYKNKYDNIIVIHQKNQGVSSARNKGLDIAKGDYIWFVDSDDIVVYNTLNEICNFLVNNKPDLLFVRPIAFDDGEDTNKFRTSNVEKDETTDYYWDWLWTRFIKRDIIKSSGVRFNPKVSFAEDHMFCTMLNPYIHNAKHFDKVVYGYRRRSNSLSTTLVKDKLSVLADSAKEFYDCGMNGVIDRDTAMIEVCTLMVSVMSTVAKLPKKEADMVVKDLKSKNIFPIKKQKNYSPDYQLAGLNLENRFLTKLKYQSYTLSGYRKMRVFRLFLKLKRRVLLK